MKHTIQYVHWGMKEQTMSNEICPLRGCQHKYYKLFPSHAQWWNQPERETNIILFFRKWLKGWWDKISLCSSKCWERYLLIMFPSSHCALPLMKCLPLAFRRRQPIKAPDDSRCAVRSSDSIRLFESDIFIPSPRIWGLFAFVCNASCKKF